MEAEILTAARRISWRVCCWALFAASPAFARGEAARTKTLLLPLAGEGFLVPGEALELTDSLREALDDVPGLGLLPKAAVEERLGFGGVDWDCADPGSCKDALGEMLEARFVVTGRVGRLGSRVYLMPSLRDVARRKDIPLLSRSWGSAAELEYARRSLAYEVGAGLALDAPLPPAAGDGPGAGPRRSGRAQKRGVPLAMILGLLPGGGFTYLERYGLAGGYLLGEIGLAVSTAYYFGRRDTGRAYLFGSVGSALKYAEIAHSGIEAKRQNRAAGFAKSPQMLDWRVGPTQEGKGVQVAWSVSF